MPAIVRHLHLDQYVAGEEFALADALLAAFHFDHLFHRHHDLAELVLHSRALDALLQRARHAFLEAGVGMHDVPLLAHYASRPTNTRTSQTSDASTIHRKIAITTTNATTTPVVCSVSLRDGHTTFLVSAME